MTVSVRRPVQEDIDAVAAIEAECFSEPWSAQAFMDVLYRDDVVLLVADAAEQTGLSELAGEDAGESAALSEASAETDPVGNSTHLIAGYVCMYMAADEGEITNVAVREDFRKMGVADMLMDELIRVAGAHGMEKIFLEVRESNIPAISLYQKKGFSQCGVRKAFYRNPVEAALLMVKELA